MYRLSADAEDRVFALPDVDDAPAPPCPNAVAEPRRRPREARRDRALRGRLPRRSKGAETVPRLALLAALLGAFSCTDADPGADSPTVDHEQAAEIIDEPAPTASARALNEGDAPAKPVIEDSPPTRAPDRPDADEPADAPAANATCAYVMVSLDLRRLGHPRPENRASPVAIRMSAESEADRFADLAPPGSSPIAWVPEHSSAFQARFDGPDAVAHCEATLAAYLPLAPRLPIILEPAASVSIPCRPCEEP